jgi:hypothetical protein
MMQRLRKWVKVGPVAVAILGLTTSSDAAPPKPVHSVPVVILAAQQIGVRQCYPAIAAIAQRATAGATMQDIILSWNHEAPDSYPFFSMTGMGNATQRDALSIIAVPAPDGQCSVLVERVSSGAGDCAAVAAKEFPTMPNAKLIDGITVFQNPQTPDETFTLIQNPGSCIVIRRQAVFKWGQKP